MLYIQWWDIMYHLEVSMATSLRRTTCSSGTSLYWVQRIRSLRGDTTMVGSSFQRNTPWSLPVSSCSLWAGISYRKLESLIPRPEWRSWGCWWFNAPSQEYHSMFLSYKCSHTPCPFSACDVSHMIKNLAGFLTSVQFFHFIAFERWGNEPTTPKG